MLKTITDVSLQLVAFAQGLSCLEPACKVAKAQAAYLSDQWGELAARPQSAPSEREQRRVEYKPRSHQPHQHQIP